jgi:hypothetical protein
MGVPMESCVVVVLLAVQLSLAGFHLCWRRLRLRGGSRTWASPD